MSGREGRTLRCFRCIYAGRTRRETAPAVCPRCKSRVYGRPRIRPIRLGTRLGIPEFIAPQRQRILRLAKQFGIRNIRVFGSVRRREAGPRSDIDLLVEWKRDASLLDVASLRIELRALLGRNIDLVNRHALHWALEPRVEAEKVLL